MLGFDRAIAAAMLAPVDELSDEPEPKRQETPKKKPAASKAGANMKRPAAATPEREMKRPAAATPPKKKVSISKYRYKTGIYGFKVDGSQKLTATS